MALADDALKALKEAIAKTPDDMAAAREAAIKSLVMTAKLPRPAAIALVAKASRDID